MKSFPVVAAFLGFVAGVCIALCYRASPASEKPYTKAVKSSGQADPVPFIPQKAQFAFNLSRANYTLSELSRLSSQLMAMDTSTLFAKFHEHRNLCVPNRLIATLIAEKIAASENAAERLSLLRILENSGNAEILSAYSSMYPQMAAADYTHLVSPTTLYGKDIYGHVRIAFDQLAAISRKEAVELCVQMHAPRRIIAVAALIKRLAGSGQAEEALALLRKIPEHEREQEGALVDAALNNIAPEILVAHWDILPAPTQSDTIFRAAGDSPLETWNWLNSLPDPNPRFIVYFLNGLRRVKTAEEADSILLVLSNSPSKMVDADLLRKAQSELATAAAANFPHKMLELLEALPEGQKRRDSISLIAQSFGGQSTEQIQAALFRSDLPADFREALIETLVWQRPKVLLSMLPSLGEQSRQELEKRLREYHGKEFELLQ